MTAGRSGGIEPDSFNRADRGLRILQTLLRLGAGGRGACKFEQGVMMAHDWVFEVLDDLRDYAAANGMQALAAKVAEARDVAVAEIAALTEGTGVAKADDRGI